MSSIRWEGDTGFVNASDLEGFHDNTKFVTVEGEGFWLMKTHRNCDEQITSWEYRSDHKRLIVKPE